MRGSMLVPPVSADDHVSGPAEAPVTLVEYGDFECSYCGMAHPIVHAIRQRLGAELRFVFRNFPLAESHPHAQHAAESAESAGSQGRFWEMHDILYEHQDALEDANLVAYAEQIGLDGERVARDLEAATFRKTVRDQFRGGVRSGVNGTPTFFINGQRFDGNWANEEEFLGALRAGMLAPSH